MGEDDRLDLAADLRAGSRLPGGPDGQSAAGSLAVSLGPVLLVLLILLLLGTLPTWPHSAGWGYYPSGGLGLVVLIVLILLLLGRI